MPLALRGDLVPRSKGLRGGAGRHRERARTTVATALGLLFVFGACTNEEDLGDRKGSGNSNGAPASLVAACQDRVSAFDARGRRCSSIPDGELYIAGYDTFCARLLAAPGVDLDMARLTACTEKIRALPCDQSDDSIAECDVLNKMQGSLSNGAACVYGGQCASGSCSGNVDLTKLACGTCQPTAAVGESCDAQRCSFEAICTSTSGGPSVCKPVLAEGAACGTGDFCGFEGYCDDANVCRANPRGGESCKLTTATGSTSLNCAGAYRCIGGVCGPPRAAGETCGDDGECDRGLACNTSTKKCASTSVPVGAACGEEAKCEPGIFCHQGKCVEGLAAGTACREGGVPCAPFYYCGPSVTCELIDPSSCK